MSTLFVGSVITYHAPVTTVASGSLWITCLGIGLNVLKNSDGRLLFCAFGVSKLMRVRNELDFGFVESVVGNGVTVWQVR